MTSTTNAGGPIIRIRACLNQLDGAFLKIATWLLKLPPDNIKASNLTTGEIARCLNLSRATVVRFCRHLGYQGFPEFKSAWIQEVSSTKEIKDVSKSEFPEGAQRVIDMTIQSMRATVGSINGEAFEKVVDAMVRASTVVWFGCPGDSAFLALSGEHKMTRAARRSRATSDVQHLRDLAQTVTAGDVLVLISHSGRWQFVVDALKPFRNKGCLIVAVTSQIDSVMAHAADVVLLAASRDISLGDGPLAFRAPQLMLIDMMVLETAQRTGSVSLRWEEHKVAQIDQEQIDQDEYNK